MQFVYAVHIAILQAKGKKMGNVKRICSNRKLTEIMLLSLQYGAKTGQANLQTSLWSLSSFECCLEGEYGQIYIGSFCHTDCSMREHCECARRHQEKGCQRSTPSETLDSRTAIALGSSVFLK